MLAKLVLVICLGVATARPKMRGGQDMVLHTGRAIALLRNPPSTSCTTITITDGTSTPSETVKQYVLGVRYTLGYRTNNRRVQGKTKHRSSRGKHARERVGASGDSIAMKEAPLGQEGKHSETFHTA
ncbi:hypothetical protein E2C01_089812 [Portunus trituberculatus]|uniref:Secreted protein n=1 Tax=Portunus trituberculatus TaxID=210409 RepID=A0A5B7JQM5_PORTR|nr:hypothetical protein [Portunus trituberculatus]